jgi:prephenate dehydrogenase
MKDRTVAVIGIGLIGGSLARALSARGVLVMAYDRDSAALDKGLAEGVVQIALDESLDGLAEAAAIVLALPTDATREIMPRISRLATNATLITDVCSTKRSVLSVAEQCGISDRFVGAHPLAGDHNSGWSASRSDLFEGATVFLCQSHAGGAALRMSHLLWRAAGADTVTIDASAHDALMASVSHVPQLAATALALTLNNLAIARTRLGPGGRDMTRLAGSSPDMWVPVVQDNADQILPVLSAFQRQLDVLRSAIEAHDPDALSRLLQEGNRWFMEHS